MHACHFLIFIDWKDRSSASIDCNNFNNNIIESISKLEGKIDLVILSSAWLFIIMVTIYLKMSLMLGTFQK